MSKDKNQTTSRADKTDIIVGIIAVLLIFAVFATLTIIASSRTVGEIAFQGEPRRGSEQLFTYTNDKLKVGDKVDWFVDNQKVATYRYNGETPQLAYTPIQSGKTVVTVVAGKYNQSTVVDVQKPILTIAARNATMTYGDETPQFEYDCYGLINDDTPESLNCNIVCKSGEIAGCGECDITFEEVDCEDYEIKFQSATLTVLPRELRIANKLEKVYDQTNKLQCSQIELDGVLDGDEVSAVSNEILLESKNAGEQKIVCDSISLVGKDSCNYKLCNEQTGKIIPKEIALEGLTVADKNYDGTTKARIEKLGVLKGVYEGDSVAIGNLDLSFSDAGVGEQQITVKNITLVGMDKDNYKINNVQPKQARITP